MVVANRCMQWEEGIEKLKSQLTDAMDANKTLSSFVAELTREKNLLMEELTRIGIEASVKDDKLKRMKESYGKALDQLKVLSKQMEMAGAYAVEEYKSFDACDDSNTKYFLAGFELLRKQAKEKYPDLDFDVFQPYEDDDSVAPVQERDEVAPSVDPQLTDDATS
jgi:predicted nuclease with TOPRIM domain